MLNTSCIWCLPLPHTLPLVVTYRKEGQRASARFNYEAMVFETMQEEEIKALTPLFLINNSWQRAFKLYKPLEINPEYSFIGRTDAEASATWYFDHLMQILWPPDAKSWLAEKILMLGKTGGKRSRWDRGWDGWMASPTQWTWVRANSRK